MSKLKRRKKSKLKNKVSGVPRNPFAHHPLMRKSCIHGPSKSSLRSKARRETRKMARDWASLLVFIFDFKVRILV